MYQKFKFSITKENKSNGTKLLIRNFNQKPLDKAESHQSLKEHDYKF